MNPAILSTTGAIGRLLLAAIFLLSGLQKLGDAAGTKAYIAAAGLPFPDLAYLVAVVIEVGFAAALIVGYRTRTVAAVMALFTLATAFGFHANFGDPNQMIQFMKNLAITGGLLQLTALGAGPLSLDSRAQRSTLATPALRRAA
jgi:putative oxidoreductase